MKTKSIRGQVYKRLNIKVSENMTGFYLLSLLSLTVEDTSDYEGRMDSLYIT